MLSKSKGQVLRVAASFHNLFQIQNTNVLTEEIDDGAITAAINFVEICCQQAAYIAGRGEIREEIEVIQASKLFS